MTTSYNSERLFQKSSVPETLQQLKFNLTPQTFTCHGVNCNQSSPSGMLCMFYLYTKQCNIPCTSPNTDGFVFTGLQRTGEPRHATAIGLHSAPRVLYPRPHSSLGFPCDNLKLHLQCWRERREILLGVGHVMRFSEVALREWLTRLEYRKEWGTREVRGLLRWGADSCSRAPYLWGFVHSRIRWIGYYCLQACINFIRSWWNWITRRPMEKQRPSRQYASRTPQDACLRLSKRRNV